MAVRFFFQLSFFILLSIPAFVHAQQSLEWQLLDDFNPREVVHILPHGRDIAAIYRDSSFLTTTDAGAEWDRHSFKPSLSSAGPDGRPRGLVYGSGRLVLAVNKERRLIRSEDGGRTWQNVEGFSYDRKSYSLLYSNGTTYYFLTHDTLGSYQVFRSTGSALSWTNVAATPDHCASFAVSPEGDLYLVKSISSSSPGTSELLKLEPDGSRWTSLRSGSVRIRAIVFGHDGILYGSAYEANRAHRWSMAAKEWVPFADDLEDSNPYGPAVTSSGEYIFLQYTLLSHPTRFVPSVIRFNPVTADTTHIPLTMTDSLDDPFACIVERDGTLWLGFEYTGWYLSKDGGKTWQRLPLSGKIPLDRINVMGENHVLALTHNQGFVSADGGNTFREITAIPRFLVQLEGKAGTDMLLFDEGHMFSAWRDILHVSRDFGESWQVSGGRTGRLLLRTRGGLLMRDSPNELSRDTGRTWQAIRYRFGPSLTNVPGYIHSVADFGGRIYLASSQRIYYSGDNGVNWQSEDSDSIVPHVRTATVTADGTLLAGIGTVREGMRGGTGYFRFRSGDSLTHALELPCTEEGSMYSFATDNAGIPWLATDCGLYRSDDDGITWAKKSDIPEGRKPRQLSITDGGTVYLVTDGGLYRASLPSSVDIDPAAAEYRIWLDASFDNADNLLTLEFSTPFSNRLRIDLYSAVGEHVATILEEEHRNGNGRLTWNPDRSLASGMYVVLLRSGRDDVSKKINLVR